MQSFLYNGTPMASLVDNYTNKFFTDNNKADPLCRRCYSGSLITGSLTECYKLFMAALHHIPSGVDPGWMSCTGDLHAYGNYFIKLSAIARYGTGVQLIGCEYTYAYTVHILLSATEGWHTRDQTWRPHAAYGTNCTASIAI